MENRKEQKIKKIIKVIKDFFSKDLWEIDTFALSWSKAFYIKFVKILYLIVDVIKKEKCMLRASALTYSTLLSIVPLLALMFSMAKGFGIQNKIRPLIINSLTAGTQDIAEKILSYVDNTDAKALGTVGLLILILSVVNVLGNIERSFNDIWRITKSRNFFRKFSDYLSVLLIVPILLVAATTITASLSNNTIFQKLLEYGFFEKTLDLAFMTIPYFTICIAFTAVYVFMPNTKVKFSAALMGGVVGATLWQISQWGYINFQVGVSKYNAIYGTFASFPIFIVWVYISWIIVLIGASISFSFQVALNTDNIESYIFSDQTYKSISFSKRELLALSILKLLSHNFYNQGERKTLGSLSLEFNFPSHFINDILDELCEIDIITKVFSSKGPYYLPSRSLENIKILDVVNSLKTHESANERSFDLPKKYASVKDLLSKIQSAKKSAIGNMTLKDFSSF